MRVHGKQAAVIGTTRSGEKLTTPPFWKHELLSDEGLCPLCCVPTGHGALHSTPWHAAPLRQSHPRQSSRLQVFARCCSMAHCDGQPERVREVQCFEAAPHCAFPSRPCCAVAGQLQRWARIAQREQEREWEKAPRQSRPPAPPPAPTVLVIVVTKNPFSWLLSMRRNPWHLLEGDAATAPARCSSPVPFRSHA